MEPMDAERREILLKLQAGADALANAWRGVDEQRARLRPQPESWSVLECVMHVALTERALMSRLKQAKDAGQSHEDRAREEKFEGLAVNRSRRIEAPPPVRPDCDSKTLVEAVEDFNATRRDTVRFVEEFGGDLRSWLTVHPLITRAVNCYEMLLLIALHPARHAQQIAEIREQLLHPRSPME